MPEGPFGGPRPFVDEQFEMELRMELGEMLEMPVADAEQELRSITSNSRFDFRPDIQVADTYTAIERGEEVEKVGTIVVNLRTDEVEPVIFMEILEFLHDSFPIKQRRSLVR